MSRFCTVNRILCYDPYCTVNQRCGKHDDDLGDAIVAAIEIGAVAASLFINSDDGDTFTGNGGDFGGGGASDDY